MLAAAIVILVELFTAEGCSSCPPADKLLEAMIAAQPAAGVEIVGLGEHVDYWNALGWKDRFSSSALTDRQQAYADRLETGTIYTPQMVVDGSTAFVGSDINAARAAIERAAALPHGTLTVRISWASEREADVTATVEGLPDLDGADRADVLIAIVEDGLRSDVKKGENAGKVLTHAAVVRSLTTIGSVNQAKGDGEPLKTRLKIAPDWKRDHVKIVAFVQARQSRRVLATTAVAASMTASSKPEAR